MKSNIKVLSVSLSSMVIGFALALLIVFPNACIPVEPPEPKACISFVKEPLRYVPIRQYLQDVGRFNNEIGSAVETKYDLMAANNADFDGKLPSRHITFSLNRLKNFIYEIDSLASKQGVDPKEMAITWSYAVYDHDKSHVKGGADFRSMQTLYAVPSRIDPDGGYLPVDIYDNFKPLSRMTEMALDPSSKPSQKTGILSPAEGGDGDAFNRGHLCPAVCNEQLRIIGNHADMYQQAHYGTLNAN